MVFNPTALLTVLLLFAVVAAVVAYIVQVSTRFTQDSEGGANPRRSKHHGRLESRDEPRP